jgi:dTDP-4-dehydrorhamnose 3,5-epimerase
MSFIFEKFEIEGLILVKPQLFGDERGFFMESYKKSEFEQNGIDCDFVQDNHSKSQKGCCEGFITRRDQKLRPSLYAALKVKIF